MFKDTFLVTAYVDLHNLHGSLISLISRNHRHWPRSNVYAGLEVIEAHYLFGCDYDDIEIVIHPQSIIHSMIETQDSSVIAQVTVSYASSVNGSCAR